MWLGLGPRDRLPDLSRLLVEIDCSQSVSTFRRGISFGRSGLQIGKHAHTSAQPFSTLSRMTATAVLTVSQVSQVAFRAD